MEQEPKTPRERAEDVISLLVPDWRPTSQQVVWGIRIVLAFVIVLGVLTLIGRPFGITVWQWLDLLIIPAVLAVGGYLFTLSDSRRTREQANHRREEDVLQAYLNQMWKLLPDKDLRSTSKANSISESEALTAARVSTLTTLERIHHSDKQRLIVKFLSMWQRSLLKRQDTVVILEGANLGRADLHEVDLLKGANLNGAKLSNANLYEADLNEANLRGADLHRADLRRANLRGADLHRADLRRANLRGAKRWTEEQLKQAKTLEGATMPNGQKYEDWLKSKNREEGGNTVPLY
jgi:uncharacterized protein YjbI with pentapeptide repeats